MDIPIDKLLKINSIDVKRDTRNKVKRKKNIGKAELDRWKTYELNNVKI